MNQKPLYRVLASTLQSYMRTESDNDELHQKYYDYIHNLISKHMPSGAGVDLGTSLDWDNSTPHRLIFNMSFHHMNGYGDYDGWTEHQAKVVPSLLFGFDILITGRNRNDIKDYLGVLYSDALSQEVDPYPPSTPQ